MGAEKRERVQGAARVFLSRVALSSGMSALILLGACNSDRSTPLRPIEARFTKPGILEVRDAKGIQSVEVQDGLLRPIARARSFGRDSFEVRFNWSSGASYRLMPDTGAPIALTAPRSKPIAALRIHAPLGQSVYEYLLDPTKAEAEIPPISVPVAPNETVDILVELEKLDDRGSTMADLSISPAFPAPEDPRLEVVLENEPVSLDFEFDKRIFQNRIRIGDDLPETPVLVSLAGKDLHAQVSIVFSKRNTSGEDLSVVGHEMPCDAEGRFMRQRAPEQISLPNPVWQKIAALFNIRADQISYYEPFVYERLDFENKQTHPLNLLLKSAVLDERTGELIPSFSAPDFSKKGLVKPVMAYCHLPAKSQTSCVLPIFVSPETKAGTYTRQLTILSMGSDRVLRTLIAKVNVIRSHLLFSVWLVVTILLSVGWLLVVALSYRKMVTAFGVRVLVLLSLLGAMEFCFNFGGSLVSQVLYAFLGPFNCLVGGLLTEVLTYLLVTSVIFLVPRVGAMTIAGIVSYLINGILCGSFGLTDILWTGSGIAFLEIFLFVFGVTRFHHNPHRRPSPLPIMLALGLADAASTFTSLALFSVLYRLFYSEWYIALQVLVTGFLYTVLGVYLGLPLGQSLKKVHL